jgi:hypothetical protein
VATTRKGRAEVSSHSSSAVRGSQLRIVEADAPLRAHSAARVSTALPNGTPSRRSIGALTAVESRELGQHLQRLRVHRFAAGREHHLLQRHHLRVEGADHAGRCGATSRRPSLPTKPCTL